MIIFKFCKYTNKEKDGNDFDINFSQFDDLHNDFPAFLELKKDINRKGNSFRTAVIYCCISLILTVTFNIFIYDLLSEYLDKKIINIIKDIAVLLITSGAIFFIVKRRMDLLKNVIYNMYMGYEELSATHEELTAVEEELRKQYNELELHRDALMKSEQRYELAAEGANDCIWDWDVQNDIYFLSGEWLKSLGYTEEDKLGETFEVWTNLLHPDDEERAIKNMQRYLASGGGIYQDTYRFRCKDGSYRWIRSRGRGIWDEEGRPIRVAGSHTDITEQIELQETLRKEKEFSENILKNASIIIVLLKTDGTIMRINPYAGKILGYTEEEICGKNWLDLFIPKKDVEHVKSLFNKIKEGQTYLSYENTIINKNGETIDVLWNKSVLYDWDGSIVGIVSIGMDITERKAMEKLLYERAYYDTLTGLPNRYYLEKAVEDILFKRMTADDSFPQKNIALIYMDIDNFKHINDILGHASGDKLLNNISEILKNHVTFPDIAARLGGDEFIIVLTDVQGENEIISRIESIYKHLRRSWYLENEEFFISMSIGVAIFPEHGRTLNTLLKNAEAAMFKAKELGKDTYCFFNKSMEEKSLYYIRMANNLRRALQNNEFLVYYQPQVDLMKDKIIGVEALIRWPDHNGSFVPPSEFIHIAEQTGFIIDIEKWMFEVACRQKKEWENKGLDNIIMSVNFSRKSLLSNRIIENIDEVLKTMDVDKTGIQVEITETDIITDINAIIDVLNHLKDRGIAIALDDFGTGYSTLNYIKELPIDVLKLDQALIKKINDENKEEPIIKTIIQLAHELNLKVVAEGIENRKQLSLLRRYNCDIGQGFLFSKPMPVENVEQLLV